MAFRSEVDALRARAEDAEAKLAVEAKKSARLDHADARLEEAKRLARASAIGSERDRRRSLALGALIGMLLGAGLVGGALAPFVTGRPAPAPLPPYDDIAALHADAERAEAERAEAVEATLRMRSGVQAVLLGLANREAPLPRPFGRVIEIRGEPPVAEGASCILGEATMGNCIARVICDGQLLHSFGCTEAPLTRDEVYGHDLRILGPDNTWSIILQFAPAPAGSPPAAALGALGTLGGAR